MSQNNGQTFKTKRVQLQVYAAVIWLLLTCALIVWWMYFAINLITQIPNHKPEHRVMLLSEGATLLFFLILGGCTLIYFILREQRLNQTLKEFFSAFSHDIKTSLSSLRLQVESLRDDLSESSGSPASGNSAGVQATLSRLLGDASRLQMQVENSLYLGSNKKPNLFFEEVEIQDIIHALQDSWPQMGFEVSGEAHVHADRRALDSIFNNVVHNAMIHGKATKLKIEVIGGTGGAMGAHIAPKSNSEVQIILTDNGHGFNGPSENLGQMHFRQNPSSGSGLGLFIVKSLMQAMGGATEFKSAHAHENSGSSSNLSSGSYSGFQVVLSLKGGRK